jgi:hypothetical protein
MHFYFRLSLILSLILSLTLPSFISFICLLSATFFAYARISFQVNIPGICVNKLSSDYAILDLFRWIILVADYHASVSF